MKKFSFVPAALFYLLLCISPLRAEILEIPGTGAVEVLLTKLAVEFNKSSEDGKVLVPPSVGSSGGIRLVGEGENILWMKHLSFFKIETSICLLLKYLFHQDN